MLVPHASSPSAVNRWSLGVASRQLEERNSAAATGKPRRRLEVDDRARRGEYRYTSDGYVLHVADDSETKTAHDAQDTY